MTETRDELFGRGWRPGVSITDDDSLPTFYKDLDIVYKTQCPKCPPALNRLRLETWRKTGHPDKCFTVCRECGHRRPF